MYGRKISFTAIPPQKKTEYGCPLILFTQNFTTAIRI